MADTSEALDILIGKGFFNQILLVVLMLTALFFAFVSFEYLLTTFMNIGGKTTQLLPYTVTAGDKQITFHQDLKKYPNGVQLPFSNNERTGIEFTYGFYLYVLPSTFTNEDTLHHVLHKGYTTPWPLMGPGVFIKGNSNTLRVVMNTYAKPYSFIDIDNIPVKKWFHVTMVCRKNAIEVYINGNLSKKLPFEGSLPYQNFQDVVLFSQLNYNIRDSTTPALANESLRVQGTFDGNMSNLVYLAYAASFTEIQALMNMGVSSKTVTSSQDTGNYLIDTYWTTSYQQLN